MNNMNYKKIIQGKNHKSMVTPIIMTNKVIYSNNRKTTMIIITILNSITGPLIKFTQFSIHKGYINYLSFIIYNY